MRGSSWVKTDELSKSGYDFNLDRIFELGHGPMLDGLAMLIEGPRR